MDKLRMMSMDNVQMNVEKIQKLFPNAVTEVLRDGKPTLAIDFDVLKQELSAELIDDKEERYQMTWPDKKKSVLLANTPISATLRPCKEESVDFDSTENLYIEGDNLDVLKLLQETYLGKIKMIYIDPPYNTGNDFVYNDDFAMDSDEYADASGQFDEQGNRLVQNTESNGRFHTDWLNMIYPRLKVAKDLLADDGVIAISLDDHEQNNLYKLCCDCFGENNFICQIPILSNPRGRQSSEFVAQTHEYITVFAKNRSCCVISGEDLTNEQKAEYKYTDSEGNFRLLGLRLRGGRCTAAESPTLHFPIYYNKLEDDFYLERKNDDDYEIIPKFEDGTLGTWRWSKQKIEQDKKYIVIRQVKDRFDAFTKDYLSSDKRMKLKSLWYEKEINYDNSSRELNSLDMGEVFDYAKPLYLIKKIVSTMSNQGGLVLDFFSGSATTAHAVMQLNAEDGGNRKFIMVQLPEKCDEKSEAYKAGYKTICDIGKERIRRAGKKIKDENPSITSLDVGFRVLKLDSSNMKDVYYKPSDYSQGFLGQLEDNIKADRTPLDLLFQVMLDLGKPLSAKIEEREIAGKHVFVVDDNDLVACFDSNVTEDVVKTIAQLKPLYAVFRDSGLSSDSVGANFDQIFATYSPNTTRKVL